MLQPKTVLLPSQTPPAEGLQKAVDDFFFNFDAQHVDETMLDMLETATFGISKMGIDAEPLVDFFFVYRQTRKFINSIEQFRTEIPIKFSLK